MTNCPLIKASKNFTIKADTINSLQYDLLQENDIDSMIDCIISTFAMDDPLSKAVNLIPDDLENFIKNIILEDCLRSKNSIVVRDPVKEKIIASILVSDFGDETEPEPEDIATLPENFIPIITILTELENQFRNDYEVKKGMYLHGIMGGVQKEYMNQGLIKNILAKAYVHSITNEYRGAFSEATGKISQAAGERMGAQTLYEISYSDFEIEEQKPFASIFHEGSCKLMLIDLN